MSAADPVKRGLVIEVARVTIELTSPLTIGSGMDDDLRDRPCVASADGLPAIPGTSLAGALRRALAGVGDPETDARACQAFGTLGGKGRDPAVPARPSAVEVSWAQVHDSRDRPVPLRGADLGDDVLATLQVGVVRDHVRIDGHGAAAHHGKFDQNHVPVGARFTLELVVHPGSGTSAAELVGLLASGIVRLGAATRRGCGEIRVVRAAARTFQLDQEADRSDFARLRRSLDHPVPDGVLRPLSFRAGAAGIETGLIEATLHLDAESTWVFGGGMPARGEHTRGKREADSVPFTEGRIAWAPAGADAAGPQRGTLSPSDRPEYVAPASGVKGALRHRVAYHARCLRREFWGPDRRPADPDTTPTEVDVLFGCIKEGDDGEPGRVFLSDTRLPDSQASTWFEHVSLDRFSGGPLDGHLYSEAPLLDGRIPLRVVVDTRRYGPRDGESRPGEPTAEDYDRARRALGLALRDLCSGHLGLGAGTTKGHGTLVAPRGRLPAGALRDWVGLGEVE